MKQDCSNTEGQLNIFHLDEKRLLLQIKYHNGQFPPWSLADKLSLMFLLMFFCLPVLYRSASLSWSVDVPKWEGSQSKPQINHMERSAWFCGLTQAVQLFHDCSYSHCDLESTEKNALSRWDEHAGCMWRRWRVKSMVMAKTWIGGTALVCIH